MPISDAKKFQAMVDIMGGEYQIYNNKERCSMREQYFIDLTSTENIKARFKELAKQYHPDLGGCVEIMKEINSQYA